MEKGEKFILKDAVGYSDGSVVSRTIIKEKGGNITLFSFDKGQGLSEHTTPFDALVNILDGKVEITIGGNLHEISEGESIILPAGIPHQLHGVEAFKMLLVMVKGKD